MSTVGAVNAVREEISLRAAVVREGFMKLVMRLELEPENFGSIQLVFILSVSCVQDSGPGFLRCQDKK